MKLSIITFLLTLAAYVSAAALAFPEEEETAIIDAIQQGYIQSVEHNDGSQELQVYDEAVYQGSIFVTAEGDLHAVDADGNEVDPAEFDDGNDDEEAAVKKRWLSAAIRAAWLIARTAAKRGKAGAKWVKNFTARVGHFGSCVGYEAIVGCSAQLAHCSTTGSWEWCLATDTCFGPNAMKCAKKHLL